MSIFEQQSSQCELCAAIARIEECFDLPEGEVRGSITGLDGRRRVVRIPHPGRYQVCGACARLIADENRVELQKRFEASVLLTHPSVMQLTREERRRFLRERRAGISALLHHSWDGLEEQEAT